MAWYGMAWYGMVWFRCAVWHTQALFKWSRGRLFDRLSCYVLYELCANTPEATVTSVRGREKRKYRSVCAVVAPPSFIHSMVLCMYGVCLLC